MGRKKRIKNAKRQVSAKGEPTTDASRLTSPDRSSSGEPTPGVPTTEAATAKPESTGSRGRVDLLWALGLSVLAAVHRIAFLHSNRDREWPFTIFYEGDSETFFRFARSILRGEVYDNGIPFHPPGFAYFLATLHELLGAGVGTRQIPHLAVKTVLAVMGGLAVGLLFLLARPYLGRLPAIAAALLASYHFGLYVISIAPVAEGLYLVLLLAILLLWSRALPHPLSSYAALDERRGSPPKVLVAGLVLGVLLGCLALTRAESVLISVILVGVGLLGWWRLRRVNDPRGGPRALLPWVLIAVGWVLAVTPWTLHNARNLEAANVRLAAGLAESLPTFVPLTLYGPLNLALGNHAGAKGTFSPDLLESLGNTGQLDLTDPEHLDLFLHGDRMAWAYLREHPGDWAALAMRKWGFFLGALRLGWTQHNLPGGLTGTRNPVDVFVPSSSLGAWLLAPWILAGLGLCLWRGGSARRWAILVVLLTAIYLVATALFFGYARLGLLLVPFWLTLAAYALAGLAERFLSHRALAGFAAATVVVLLVVELRGVGAERNYRATGTTLPGSQKLNRDLPVELEPLPAESSKMER